MRKRARKELEKKNKTEITDEKSEKPSKIKKEEKTPSFISGFLLILFGSLTFSFFYAAGQTLLGILASAAFVIIGMSRIFKASAARAKPEMLSA